MPVMLVLASSFLLFIFQDKVSLCSAGYPGTHSVDQAGLQIRDSADSASWVLGLKSCTITAQLKIIFISGQPGMHKTLSQKTTIKPKSPASIKTVVSLRWLYHSSVSSSLSGAMLNNKFKKRLTLRVVHMVMYHLSILDTKGRDQCAEGVDSVWGQVQAGFVLSTWLGLSQRKELQLGKCFAADPLGSLCLSGTGLWGRWANHQREWWPTQEMCRGNDDQHKRLCRIWMYYDRSSIKLFIPKK